MPFRDGPSTSSPPRTIDDAAMTWAVSILRPNGPESWSPAAPDRGRASENRLSGPHDRGPVHAACAVVHACHGEATFRADLVRGNGPTTAGQARGFPWHSIPAPAGPDRHGALGIGRGPVRPTSRCARNEFGSGCAPPSAGGQPCTFVFLVSSLS